MDDLISRESVLEQIKRKPYWFTSDGYCALTYDDIETAINNMPAAKDAPVVRCEECQHRGSNKICVKLLVGTKDSFFCAFGKRREE